MDLRVRLLSAAAAFFSAGLLTVLVAAPTHSGGGSHRSIQSIATTTSNQFDPNNNEQTNVRLNLTGGAAAGQTPDSEAGFRLEIFNSSGNLVRRLSSEEIDGNATLNRSFNGRDDSNVLLPYGAYTLRARTSMRDPIFQAAIEGGGITIDRPGDLHVTDAGVLSWTNNGTTISFCQVSLGDPNNEEPTFLRHVDYTNNASIGSVPNADAVFGIVMSSNDRSGFGLDNEVFITHNQLGARIAKYNIATETFISYTWATNATTTGVTDDEWIGLGIDQHDSIYVGLGTNTLGGSVSGSGGGDEGWVHFKDGGNAAVLIDDGVGPNDDYYDVAPSKTGIGGVWGLDEDNGQIDRWHDDPDLLAQNPWFDHAANGSDGSIWVTSDSAVYFTDQGGDSFGKVRDFNRDSDVNDPGEQIYQVHTRSQSPNGLLDNIRGICVWEKKSTGETFVIVSSTTRNQITIWKEIDGPDADASAGDSVQFIRTIDDDPSNLNDPIGIAISPLDSAIYVVSSGQRAVKKFSNGGVFQNLVGSYNGKFIQGNDNTGTLTDSSGFVYPTAIAVDDTGNIYVFDHSATATPTHIALKKFGPTGTPLGIITDFDALDGNFNRLIHQAVWKNNSVYVATEEQEAKVMRISNSGTLLQYLGDDGSMAVGPTTHGGNPSLDFVYAIYSGPFYDTGATPRFYPDAVYLLGDNGGSFELLIYNGTLSTVLHGPTAPTNPALNGLTANPNGLLVDDFGEIFVLECDNDGSGYEFNKWNAATRDRNPLVNGMLEYIFYDGTANGAFQSPRQMIWGDGRGIFSDSANTSTDFWVSDLGNNRLQKFTLAWHDVEDTPLILRVSQETPTISSVTITGDSVATIGGVTYVGLPNTPTRFQFNFVVATGQGMENDSRPVVTIYPSIGGVPQTVTVDSVAYLDGGTSWTGTTTVLAAWDDGEVQIQMDTAWDNGGTGSVNRRMSPDPDRSDLDLADDFKPFTIDQTGPVFDDAQSLPPSSGASTPEATYVVSGQIQTEATGLDARIFIQNFTLETGGVLFDQFTLGSATGPPNGRYEGTINLRSPAPSSNYIQVIAEDRLGNKTTLGGGRRLVTRIRNVGTAFVEPATSIQVNTLRNYQFRYTAAQSLSGDSVRFKIPSDWSDLQNASTSSNGYYTLSTTGSYTTATVENGETLLVNGVTLAIGGSLTMSYGDSAANINGRARPDINASLSDVDNTFRVELQQAGEDTWSSVPAASGKSLIVSVFDSSPAVAIHDTDLRVSNSATIPKGDDTRVMTVRVYNSNIGNHTHRLSSFTLQVEGDSSSPNTLHWSGVASQVRVRNSALGVTYATVTTMPASANLTITPTTDFKVTSAADSLDFEIYVTFAPTATADSARFYFAGPSNFVIVDDGSGNSLTELEFDTGITRKSGIYDIIGLSPADTVNIDADTSFTNTSVSTRQKGVDCFDIYLENKPATTSAVNSARISQIRLAVRTAALANTTPSNVLSAVYIKDASTGQTYGSVSSVPTTVDSVTVNLTGLTISSGQTAQLRISVDIAGETTSISSFRIGLHDTTSVSAVDITTNLTADRFDDPASSKVFRFYTDTIVIIPRATAVANQLYLLQSDSTDLNPSLGENLIAGSVFYVQLNYKDSANRGTLRVEPSDTDLSFFIAGVDRTSEFTINTKSSPVTIAPGAQDTVTYGVTHIGTSTGILQVQMRDTGATTGDTRPRLFDSNDYFDPDKLRALMLTTYVRDTVTIVQAGQTAASRSVGQAFANAGEQRVPILAFSVTNNSVSGQFLDSVTVEAISANSSVVEYVRLWSDHEASGHGVFSSTQDTLVASGTLGANDTVRLQLSPMTSIGPNGDTRIFFITFDFAGPQTDGDTFDAQIPIEGISFQGVTTRIPSATALNSTGTGLVEVVATRLTMTPDTQIVAVGSSPSFTLNAVDSFGNIDNLINPESSVEGSNLQVTITLGYPDADSTHHIKQTSGLANVTPAVGPTVREINANLSNGAGSVTITDAEPESFSITVASILNDSTGAVQFANLTTAAVVNFDPGKAAPESTAYQILRFQITNASGATDTLTSIGIVSLNDSDTNITFVTFWADSNSNNQIDSFTDSRRDTFLGIGTLSNGKLEVSGFSLRMFNGETRVIMVGYDLVTAVTDNDILDARADTIVVEVSGDLVTGSINSTPAGEIEVTATRIAMEPTSGNTGTGNSFTVLVEAVDDFGNRDEDYTDGGSFLNFDFTGSAFFTSTTLANEDISPPQTALGDLVSGFATLTFTNNSQETEVLFVASSPGLSGTDDTATIRFDQGFTVTALALAFDTASPGDTNLVAISFRISAAGTSDSVVRIQATWKGTDTRDVTNVRMFRDADTSQNEVFNFGIDRLFGQTNPGSFVGETVTFSNDTVFIANGTSRAFYLVMDVRESATVGDTIDVELRIQSCSTVGNLKNVPGGIRNSTGWETVAIAAVRLSAGFLSDVTTAPGETIVAGHFALRNPNKNGDTVAKLVVQNRGTITNGEVTSVQIFFDHDNDGVLDGDDTSYAAASAINAQETVAFTGSIRIAAVSTETFFVVYTVAGGATSGDTISVGFNPGGVEMRYDTGRTIPSSTRNSPDSVIVEGLGVLSGDSIALTNATHQPGAESVVIGSFRMVNGTVNLYYLDTVTIRNGGTHPDTGLFNVRLFIDGNNNSAYDATQDTPFGSRTRFTNDTAFFNDSFTLKANRTQGLIVLVDLSDTLAVDSALIKASIDARAIGFLSGETLAAVELYSNDRIHVRSPLAQNGDSILVEGGAGVENDTIWVTVTIRDTSGVPSQGRSVQLFAYQMTILSANPKTTDTSGVVAFAVETGVAGAYRCTVTIDGSVNPGDSALVSVLSTRMAVDSQFTANTQRVTATGSAAVDGKNRMYMSPPSFSRDHDDRFAQLVFNNHTYTVQKHTIGGGTATVWSVDTYGAFAFDSSANGTEPRAYSRDTPGVTHYGNVRVRKLKGVPEEAIVFSGYFDSTHFGTQIYYKEWDSGPTEPPTRISPNDTRAQGPWKDDGPFNQFDISPGGDSIVFSFNGDLAWSRATGSYFDPDADSATIRYYTTFQPAPGSGVPGKYAAYPEYSPDSGRRVVFNVLYLEDWDSSVAPLADRSEIFVLYNLSAITPTLFPTGGAYPGTVTDTTKTKTAHLVRLTDYNSLRFAWQPHWSTDGSIVFFSGTEGAGFDWDKFYLTEEPEEAFSAAGVDFDMYMVYYDQANETAPYAPIKLTNEIAVDELAGEMSANGTYVGYTRTTSQLFYEARTMTISSEATVNSTGGVLFDSGRVAVVIPAGAVYDSGFVISSRTPDSTPTGSESTIITGNAKLFFRPDTPTSHVYFADSVIVILYYDINKFTDTELEGFDSDGDGIPDRTEAAVSAYFWDGNEWIEYQTTRFPAENKIQFFTDHFSQYAVGLSAEVRALVFTGSVQDIVAYPNPWRIDGPTSALSPSDERYGIKFTNFPAGSTRVRLYTLAGELVLDETVDALNATSTNAALRVTAITNNARGTVSWNLRNRSGREVASGVYLAVFEGQGGRATRKVAIIR